MKEDDGHLIAESAADFDGWEIMHARDWKDDIKQVWCRKIDGNGANHFIIVFSKAEFVPKQ